ncbi:MAG: hypothetical protein WCO55_03690 [Candidatus Falkowbacteria bacterium]
METFIFIVVIVVLIFCAIGSEDEMAFGACLGIAVICLIYLLIHIFSGWSIFTGTETSRKDSSQIIEYVKTGYNNIKIFFT